MRSLPAVGATAIVLALAGCGSGGAIRGDPEPRSTPARIVVSPVEQVTFLEMAVRQDAGDLADRRRSQTTNQWRRDPRIALEGAPTAEDRARLGDAARTLSALMAPRRVVLTQERPTVRIHFVPKAEFAAVLGTNEFPADADGVTQPSVTLGRDEGRIEAATVVIDSTIPQYGRNRVIVHELLHVVGLGHSSCKSSVLYAQGGGDVSPLWSMSALDQRMVELLYRPEVEPGMGEDRIAALLTPSALVGARCEPARWQLVIDTPDQRPYFCATGPERYRPCTGDVSVEPVAPLARVDLWFDGTYLYEHRPDG